MDQQIKPASIIPPPRDMKLADLWQALRQGWRDYRRAPLYGFVFSMVYVLGGWLMVFALTQAGQIWWTIPASFGFPLLGPFIAVGFYEISRRLEVGEPMTPSAIFGVICNERHRQIPWLAAVIVIFFLFWNFLSHMIFAVFMGHQVMINVSSSFAIFLTPNGLGMLVVGTAFGAIFAALLFSITVVAIPLLLHREVDFVTAMLTSIDVVKANPKVMLVWAAVIAILLGLAILPGFLGLFVVLPLLGHASWHLYRKVIPD